MMSGIKITPALLGLVLFLLGASAPAQAGLCLLASPRRQS